jgi:hypothetical protein
VVIHKAQVIIDRSLRVRFEAGQLFECYRNR